MQSRLPGVALGSQWVAYPLRVLSSPITVERKPGDDEQQADGRAARANEPEVDGENHSAENEKPGHPGVAPAAIGTLKVRFGLAQAEQSDDGKAVKNPRGEDKEVRKFFERAGEGHQAGQGHLENQRAAGSAVFGMDAVGDAEEDAVAGHGVRDTRTTEDGGVH